MGRIRVADRDYRTYEGRTIQRGMSVTAEDESADPIEISIDVHSVFHVDRATFLSSTRLATDLATNTQT
jgi:hypothetical protein